MKKIILIFLSLLCISCSTLTAFTQHTANSDDVQKLMAKGALELMTPQERKDYEAGKTVNMIGFQSASRGVVLDKLTSMANLSKGKIDEDVVTAIAMMEKYPGTIFVSDNNDVFVRTIMYLGQSEEGRKLLKGSRFLFINNFNESKVRELAQKYNFKCSFPKLNE